MKGEIYVYLKKKKKKKKGFEIMEIREKLSNCFIP